MDSTRTAPIDLSDDRPSTSIWIEELALEFSGAIYYVTRPANGAGTIIPYVDEPDKFLKILGETCIARNWRCFAYCLLHAGYQIAIQTDRPNLNEGLAELHCRLNAGMGYIKKHGATLFDEKANILVVSPELLRETIRHVLQGPLRAGTIKQLVDWPASSYHLMINKSSTPPWLDVQTPWTGKHTSGNPDDLGKFVKKQTDLSHHTLHGLFLGDSFFVKSVIDNIQHGLTINDRTDRDTRQPLAEYLRRTSTPAGAMREAFRSGGYKLKEIAEFFDVHYTVVSRAING